MVGDRQKDMEILSREVKGLCADSERMFWGCWGQTSSRALELVRIQLWKKGGQCLVGNGQHTGFSMSDPLFIQVQMQGKNSRLTIEK